MRRRLQRLRANLHYLKQPIRNFIPLLLLLAVILVTGAFCFHFLYRGDGAPEGLSYPRALYITYCLIFMEHLLPFPEHWALQLFYVILPPLGLVVILDGFARFGYHLLRRDETGKEWVRAMAKTMSNHVVLCGLGKVGVRILQQLLRLGEEVIVLESDPQCPNLAYAQKHGVPVLIGTGRQEGILDDLNVAKAKSVISATDDDLANLEMAIDARKIKPNIRVVLRMFDQELAAKIRESFDIHLGISTSELSAPLFATSSSDRSIVNAFYVNDALLVVAELEINDRSELAGRQIGKVSREHRIIFVSHSRGGEATFYPDGDMQLEVGDQVTIQTEPDTLKLVHQWNRDKQPY